MSKWRQREKERERAQVGGWTHRVRRGIEVYVCVCVCVCVCRSGVTAGVFLNPREAARWGEGGGLGKSDSSWRDFVSPFQPVIYI